MKIEIAKNNEEIQEIVKIHIDAFPNFFLTCLLYTSDAADEL